MWGSLTNTAVRIVAIALAIVALLGFYLGIRGAMPTNDGPEDSDAPVAAATGPVQEVQPIQEVIPPPPVAPPPKTEDANAAAAKPADEDEVEPAPVVTPLPPPKTVRPPPAANTAPADPIGNLIQSPPPAEPPPDEVPF